MKNKKLFKLFLLPLMVSSLVACDNGGTSVNNSTSGSGTQIQTDIIVPDVDCNLKNVTITFWNPITGPDARYLQDLVDVFNNAYEGKIKVKLDSQDEDNHYQRILTSFSDNSTADLSIIHKSRISSFNRANKLRDISNILSNINIKEDDYVGDSWAAGEFDGKMYGLTIDVIPMVVFYNRKLIPAGYTEEDILSDNFTVEKMVEMCKAAYKDAPVNNKKTYGISFNYGYTENMFISFLNQLGGAVVDVNNPTVPTFNNQAGYTAAETLRSIPTATVKIGDKNVKVASESGADHLSIFMQGRALFTFDGIWSAPNACKKTTKLDPGVALFPKVNETATRTSHGDGHMFVMFNNKTVSNDKDEAMSIFIDYFVKNTNHWCNGGKIAARKDTANNENYKKLEWSYLSNKLEMIISPQKTYTYDTLIKPIGKYVADLCEGRSNDIQSAINSAAKEAKEAAERL